MISCEHAGHAVPDAYKHLFAGQDEALHSHRGWDPGAWDAALFAAERLGLAAYGCFTTRLLVEANRSLHSSELFSEYSRTLSDEAKKELIATVYTPYRDNIERIISGTPGPVLHLSIHTFTPLWEGAARAVEIGLLFDPVRKNEEKFCRQYLLMLQETLPGLDIRFNEPYKGVDDGFTTYLRTKFPDDKYAGIELELNQKFLFSPHWPAVKEGVARALEGAVRSL